MADSITIPYNFDPYVRPYQVKILENKARFKFLTIHRKAGKTALSINKINQTAMLKRGVIWYVAPTYKQGKEIVWRDPQMIPKYTPREILVKKNESELILEYTSGSIMGVKGADYPDSLRGPNPMLVILDEVYLMKPEIWTEIILPIAVANPEMEVWFIGTPKPIGAFWHDLFLEAQRLMESDDPDWFAMSLDAEHSGIIAKQHLEMAQRTMTQAAYEQEFLVKWLGDKAAVFRGVDLCVDPALKLKESWDSKYTYQFGIDLAMQVDWTVAIGINKQRHAVEVFDRYNQIDYPLQKARLEAMLRRFGNPLANVDATGVGEPIVQDLAARGLAVNGIKITEVEKRNLITNLAIWIEQRKIKIPPIPELVQELKIFGYEVIETKSSSGLQRRIRYGAPEGYHDDCVLALALAVKDLGSKLPMQINMPFDEQRKRQARDIAR